MKCGSCKGEWTPPPEKTVTECPFCEKSFAPRKTPKTFDNAKDALRFIARSYGAESLLAKNLFSDIAPSLNDERELIKIFREKGALEVLKGAINSPPSKQSVSIKRATAKLPVYLQNSPEAISLLYDFAEALGWLIDKPESAHAVSQQETSAPYSQAGLIIRGMKKFAGCDWLVLDERSGGALLLRKQIWDTRPYHRPGGNISWENCTIRKELNNEFYYQIPQSDRVKIYKVPVYNKKNDWYNKEGGNDTEDFVFLLSLEEVDKYFGDSGNYTNKKRKMWENNKWISGNNGWAFSNDCDKDRKAFYNSKACWWWLRSPGFLGSTAASVGPVGAVNVHGDAVRGDSGGIRPALWLNLTNDNSGAVRDVSGDIRPDLRLTLTSEK